MSVYRFALSRKAAVLLTVSFSLWISDSRCGRASVSFACSSRVTGREHLELLRRDASHAHCLHRSFLKIASSSALRFCMAAFSFSSLWISFWNSADCLLFRYSANSCGCSPGLPPSPGADPPARSHRECTLGCSGRCGFAILFVSTAGEVIVICGHRMCPVEGHRLAAVGTNNKPGILVLLIHLCRSAFVLSYPLHDMVNKMGYDEYSSQISGVHRAVSMLQIGKEKNKSNKL